MIRSMTRYSFLLYHADTEAFLLRLRELGVVDITTTDYVLSDAQRELWERVAVYGRVCRSLSSISPASSASSSSPSSSSSSLSIPSYANAEQAVVAYQGAVAELEVLRGDIARAEREADELEVWGDFDPLTIRALRDEGVNLRFFETDVKSFQSAWAEMYPLEVVRRTASQVYFVVAESSSVPSSSSSAIGSSSSEAVAFPLQVVELRAPEFSQSQKLEYVEQLKMREVGCHDIVARVAAQREMVAAEYARLSEEFELGKVMGAGVRYAEDTLVALEGWSYVEEQERIVAFADSHDVVYTFEAAREEQNPPIELKNNFFARLFEPIGSLYMLPRYNEMDMTPYFAPFFMVFFGMCFGDAGYGVLFILGILLFWKKIPVKYRGFGWLGIFLNISTIFFGLMTGNVFGIELAKIAFFEPVKHLFVPNESMFNVAIGLGATQIFFGLILRIFNRAKKGGDYRYGLSALGWVLLIASSGVAFLEPAVWFSFGSIGYYCALGVSAVLIFLFNSPGKNPFVNVGLGLYNCYEMATGVVGDLVSYVRLFAIGLTGAIIAQVFNALAQGLSGDIPVVSFLVMCLILLVGHALNIFVSILGAFVHPVRLTFVEFFKNAEFAGGGRPFTPFRRFNRG